MTNFGSRIADCGLIAIALLSFALGNAGMPSAFAEAPAARFPIADIGSQISDLGSIATAADGVASLPDPKGFVSVGWVLIAIGVLVGAITAALGLVWTIMQIVEKIKGARTPQPFRVSKEPNSVREEDMEALRKEMIQRFAQVDNEVAGIKSQLKDQLKKMDDYQHDFRHELRDSMQALVSTAEERTVKLHERINQVLTAVSRMEGKLL